MASLPWKSNVGDPSDEELVTCFPASTLQASNRNESTAVAQLIHAPARPAPTQAEKEDFCRVIEKSYADLLAYARGRLGERAIPATQQGRGKLRTRFAAEERVHEAVADLLEDGSYASCATDEERRRFLTSTVMFRLKREFRARKVRRQRQHLPLQTTTDDPLN